MAGSLPTVRGGFQCLTPIARTVSFSTDIAIGLNGGEQRFKRRPCLTQFKLRYTRMPAADVASMRNFFESQKGSFDSTWSFVLASTTYSHLCFTDDTFRFTEDAATPTLYSFDLNCRQTQNPGQAAGAAGAAFPLLASGARSLLPYVQTRRFAVLLNDSPIGPRYSYSWFGSGLTGFPTRSLRGWELTYPILSDADTATIETHFRNQWGRWAGGWTFTDPDDLTAYTSCRYDLDALEIVNNGPNINSLTLRILEIN